MLRLIRKTFVELVHRPRVRQTTNGTRILPAMPIISTIKQTAVAILRNELGNIISVSFFSIVLVSLVIEIIVVDNDDNDDDDVDDNDDVDEMFKFRAVAVVVSVINGIVMPLQTLSIMKIIKMNNNFKLIFTLTQMNGIVIGRIFHFPFVG